MTEEKKILDKDENWMGKSQAVTQSTFKTDWTGLT
jgi:hypothetical protein